MAAVRLYCPCLTPGENVLSSEESHHLLDVRRVGPGFEVVLFDGAGREAAGVVRRVERNRAVVHVDAIVEKAFEFSLRVTLAVTPIKQHRFAYLIEKCTELGAAAFWPLIAARGVVRSGESAVTKWRRRAIEAAKQSGRTSVPDVVSPQPFQRVAEQARGFDAAALCDAASEGKSVNAFLRTTNPPAQVLILIGPEGGWTDQEREIADCAGLERLRLSPTTLRTETAAVAVCAAAAAVSVE